MTILHALVSGLLVFAVYLAVDHMGYLEGRSRWGRFVVLLPILFVVVFAFNFVWERAVG